MIPSLGDLMSRVGLGDLAFAAGLGPNPASKDLDAALQRAREDYNAYRPEAWAARMGALDKTMQLFQPVNMQMERMYGAGSTVPLSAAFDYSYATPAPGDVAQEKAQADAPVTSPPSVLRLL